MTEHWMDEVPEGGEFWTDEQVGKYLRLQGHSIKDTSVRAWRAARRIRMVPMVSAELVKAEEKKMVGRGRKRRTA